MTDTGLNSMPTRLPARAPLQFHPLADIFPLVGGEEFDELVADIAAHGLEEPIDVFEGQILDGRNRYRACESAGVEPIIRAYGGDAQTALAFVISKNLRRRHLTESQRAMVAAKLANMRQGARTDLAPIGAMSDAAAAATLSVGERSVERAKTVQREGSPELVAAVEAGAISVSAAADVATLPKEEQTELVARGEKEILEAAKQIRSERADRKRADRTELLHRLSNANAPLPSDRRYPIIYADPPWQYDFSPSNDRSVENHYPTMAIEEICSMEVERLATPDAMLFLWAPPSFIQKGLRVLEAWGFELATSMVWVKDKIGTGIYVRQRHEYLLLGKRGQPITPRPGSQPDSVIEAPRLAHSEKPGQVYGLIEQMYPDLAKIELFGRAARSGWDAWGNEVAAAEHPLEIPAFLRRSA